MLILLVLAAVLASSVIDQLVPKVSSPLIQIALGLVIAFVAGGQIDIIFEQSDLFLVLFIAPLLFDEAKNANKTELWRTRLPVTSLAIGLVVATTLVIGFFLHAIVPSISLAAAFALGAALGPTDAVAVASVSKGTDISPRCKSILKGESLINDASGIVAFQFALAAAITGTFSITAAATDFAYSFVGGILSGLLLGYVGNALIRLVRSWGLENTTFHVLFEVFTPFIVFLIAEQFHVSGILAVVAAGLVNVISPRTLGPSVSRLNIVSTSVWRVLSFTLNGIVFVLLGTQLPRAMQHSWENVTIPNELLIGYVFALTAILLGARFLWVLVMERVHHRRVQKRNTKQTNDAARPQKKTLAHDVRSAAIMTFGGPKGTITLAVVLTIPPAIAQQQLILFLACGVIVVTLLLATFLIPVLAPTSEEDNEEQRKKDAKASLDILRSVIEELSARQTDETRTATQVVISSYNDRISRIKDLNGFEDEPNLRLRLRALEWEEEFVTMKLHLHEVEPYVGYQYLARLAHMRDLVKHHRSTRVSLRRQFLRIRALARRSMHEIVHRMPGASLSETTQAKRSLQIKSYEYVVAKLREEMASSDSPEKTEDVSALLLEYLRLLRTLRNSAPSITAMTAVADRATDIERLGLELELEQIQTRYEDGELSRAAAKRLRENVNLMQMDVEDNV